MTVSDQNAALGLPADAPTVDSLYRTHRNWLLAFLRRRFAPQDAEDLAQDAYLRALNAQTEIRNPRAFLAQVARSAAYDQGRQTAAHTAAVAEYAHREHLARTPPGVDPLALKQAILALPPKLRQVFLLSRFVGLSYAEIAERCGVSVDTVQERMTKALTICSALMRD
jgi:RNA polymerase sigma-70 factor (ECF subfamily)